MPSVSGTGRTSSRGGGRGAWIGSGGIEGTDLLRCAAASSAQVLRCICSFCFSLQGGGDNCLVTPDEEASHAVMTCMTCSEFDR